MRHTIVHTCSNGMRALVWPRQGSSVVSVQVWVETGSMLEGAAYAGSGVSHLLEHMVFKGTEEYNVCELGEAVSALGGLWNAYTSTDRTVFHIDGPAAHWRQFLHILAQLTLHPTFPEDEWEREREVIRREMDMYRDDPNDASYRALIETLYTMHPRRLPVIGERAAFDALTPEDMKRYHAERYVPSNMFVCVVGGVSPEEVSAAVESEFASSSRAKEMPALPDEPRQWGPRVLRREFPQPTSTLMLAWRIPHANHPDTAALALLSFILGDGRSAWLYKAFHDERAMAHDVSTLVIPHAAGEGAFVIEAEVERARRDDLRAALLEWVADLPQADFEAALRRACRQQRVRQLKALSTVQGAADMLGSFWRHSRNTGAWDEWMAALEGVSVQDLQRVATQWLQPQRLTEVSIDPVGSNALECSGKAAAERSALREFSLTNGLRCVLRVDKSLPMVHAALAVGGGCRAESRQDAGICSLLAETLPKGTATRNAARIAAQAEDMGGALHVQAGNNTLMLTIKALSEEAPAMLDLLADVALRPSFPEEALQMAREDLIADVQEEEEDPVGLAFRRLRRFCFGEVSYGNTPGGEADSLAALTREDVLSLHARLMRGGNVVLSIAGDMDAAAIEAHVREAFAPLPAGSACSFAATPRQKEGDFRVPSPCDKEQAVLAIALPALPLHHEDQPLLALFDEWCQDMAGPIYTEIREKRGLAYHASSSLLLGVDAGCLYFSLETSPKQMPEAREILEATLNALAENGMPPEALERARATSLASRLLATQSVGKMCSAAAVDTLLGLGADHLERSMEALAHIRHEQMQAFIRRLLSPATPRTCLTMLPH